MSGSRRLPFDYARCHGEGCDAKWKCERYLQRFFASPMTPFIVQDACIGLGPDGCALMIESKRKVDGVAA